MSVIKGFETVDIMICPFICIQKVKIPVKACPFNKSMFSFISIDDLTSWLQCPDRK